MVHCSGRSVQESYVKGALRYCAHQSHESICASVLAESCGNGVKLQTETIDNFQWMPSPFRDVCSNPGRWQQAHLVLYNGDKRRTLSVERWSPAQYRLHRCWVLLAGL